MNIYILIDNSLSQQTGPINRYKLGQKFFWNPLNNLEDWGKVSGPFQFRNLLKLLTNQLCQDSSCFHFSGKVKIAHLKIVNVDY